MEIKNNYGLESAMSVSIDQEISLCIYIYHLKPGDLGVELFPSEAWLVDWNNHKVFVLAFCFILLSNSLAAANW